MRPPRWRWMFVAGVLAAAAVLAALHQRTPTREVLLPRGTDLDAYVGAAKCADCHRELYERQSKSRMGRALASGAETHRQHTLPLPAEVADPKNGLRYRVEARRGELVLKVSRGDETAEATMDYALGSGQRGLSFVRDRDAQAFDDLRISYYSDSQTWDLTPGQEDVQPESLEKALGRRVDKRSPGACLTCHASRLVQTADRIDARSSIFGVDCERCHGPGREHSATGSEQTPARMRPLSLAGALALAEQFRRGQPPATAQDAALARVASANDDRLIRDLYVCGECHGRQQMGVDPSDEHIARFQVPALLASRCYQRSTAKLRCTDCHDPHTDAVHGDERPYVAVCLRCHAPEERGSEAVAGVADGNSAHRVCRHSERAGCIRCHMPVTTPMYRTHFTQHRIGVYPELSAPTSVEDR